MKLTTARITTLLLMLSAVVLLALSACSSDGNDGSDWSKNTAPVADAGMDQHPKTGSFVTLDGSWSHDADHDLLTYVWSMTPPPGSNATLSGADTSHPKFTADVDGDYMIELIVNDGLFDSAADSVKVTATHDNANAIPVAHAGDDQHVKTNASVTLDGSKSHDADDGDTLVLVYKWTWTHRPDGSSAILFNTTAKKPSFTPDVDGEYDIELIVDDLKDKSAPDTVTVTATDVDANAAPVAHAGDDQDDAKIGKKVTLDGSGSKDADGDQLSHRWTVQSHPKSSTVSLSDATAESPTFTPDVWGSYIFKLIVNDGQVNSAPDRVSVHVTPGCGTFRADPSYCVFVTSTRHTGNLGGLSGADTICNDLANNAGMPGVYKAWLSGELLSPRNRFDVDEHIPFQLETGRVVAPSWVDLVDNTHALASPIDITDRHEQVLSTLPESERRVWTNTDTDGTRSYAYQFACREWTSDAQIGDPSDATAGDTRSKDERWTLIKPRETCSQQYRLYCFEQKPPSSN